VRPPGARVRVIATPPRASPACSVAWGMATDTAHIGRRARLIRRRRGMSLDVAAGLAGISKGYLSRLERGERNFERRGLLEDLAGALGCSVADLTGQPYPPTDRDTADAMAALPGIRVALADYDADDVPDVNPRPLDELVSWARNANEHRDHARFSLAGHDIGALIWGQQRLDQRPLRVSQIAGVALRWLRSGLALARRRSRRSTLRCRRHGVTLLTPAPQVTEARRAISNTFLGVGPTLAADRAQEAVEHRR